jgi:hypothetical protein
LSQRESIIDYNMDEPWKYYAELKNPNRKDHILEMSRKSKSIQIKSRLVVDKCWGEGKE